MCIGLTCDGDGYVREVPIDIGSALPLQSVN